MTVAMTDGWLTGCATAAASPAIDTSPVVRICPFTLIRFGSKRFSILERGCCLLDGLEINVAATIRGGCQRGLASGQVNARCFNTAVSA